MDAYLKQDLIGRGFVSCARLGECFAVTGDFVMAASTLQQIWHQVQHTRKRMKHGMNVDGLLALSVCVNLVACFDASGQAEKVDAKLKTVSEVREEVVRILDHSNTSTLPGWVNEVIRVYGSDSIQEEGEIQDAQRDQVRQGAKGDSYIRLQV